MTGDSANPWAWDGNEQQFPSQEIQEWEFFTNPSDDQNVSDNLGTRCEPELARHIDELVMEAKAVGIGWKTRSDFVRWACARSVPELEKYLGATSESRSHYMLVQRQIQRAAQTAEMLTGIKTHSKRMASGIQVIMKDKTQTGFQEAVKRMTEFLTPVMEMVGSNDYLMRLYVKEFFGSSSIQNSLVVLKKADEDKMVKLGAVITNAEKAYERISAEN